MNRIHQAIRDVHTIDDLSRRNLFVNYLHPLFKLIAVLVYLVITISYGPYDLLGVLSMGIYILILYPIADLSLKDTLYKFRCVLSLLFFVGILNLFFDKEVLFYFYSIPITSGCISMLVLMLKGIFTFFVAYFLIATTGMEALCAALQSMHMPKILVVTILLIYRYVIVLLQDVNRLSLAYSLRAPDHKGIQYEAWGSMLGQLLLKSIDRAQIVYESMLLRGFNGMFYYEMKYYKSASICFFSVSILYCFLCRVFPVFEIIGGMF